MRITTQTWNHAKPYGPALNQELQLLTIGGISVIGRWAGEFGEYFVGWHYYTPGLLLHHNHTQQRTQDETHL